MKQQLLIVDDNNMMRSFLSHYFSKGYEVQVAGSGKEAWRWLDDGYFPDLILLDLRMPEMSGMDFLCQLKSSVLFHDIPVIMVSSISKTAEKIECLRSGAADYVTKPFNPKEVEARVNYHLQARRA